MQWENSPMCPLGCLPLAAAETRPWTQASHQQSLHLPGCHTGLKQAFNHTGQQHAHATHAIGMVQVIWKNILKILIYKRLSCMQAEKSWDWLRFGIKMNKTRGTQFWFNVIHLECFLCSVSHSSHLQKYCELFASAASGFCWLCAALVQVLHFALWSWCLLFSQAPWGAVWHEMQHGTGLQHRA